jgi:copper(I)-binding protein
VNRLRTTCVACASALLLAACGGGETADDASSSPSPGTAAITVVDAWARPAEHGANTAVYLTLVNTTAMPDSVTGVSTPLAESASLHETMQHDGMMHMQAVAALTLPPGDTLRLAPLGTHVMVMHLARALAIGDTLPLTLVLGSGATRPVSAVIRAP